MQLALHLAMVMIGLVLAGGALVQLALRTPALREPSRSECPEITRCDCKSLIANFHRNCRKGSALLRLPA